MSSRIDTEGERSIAAAEIKITALSEQIDAVRETVSALASDTEQSRQILREANSSIEHTRKTAETSEAEFFANSNIKVTLVPYPEGLSMKLANEISNDLTSLGFKVTRSQWSGKKNNFKGDIRIAFQPIVEDKTEFLVNVLQNSLKKTGLSCTVKLEKKDLPISNSDSNLVVFFE